MLPSFLGRYTSISIYLTFNSFHILNRNIQRRYQHWIPTVFKCLVSLNRTNNWRDNYLGITQGITQGITLQPDLSALRDFRSIGQEKCGTLIFTRFDVNRVP